MAVEKEAVVCSRQIIGNNRPLKARMKTDKVVKKQPVQSFPPSKTTKSMKNCALARVKRQKIAETRGLPNV
jgi:hypothetical protein